MHVANHNHASDAALAAGRCPARSGRRRWRSRSAFAISARAAAQDFDLTMGVLPSPNSLYTTMMDQVPERIERATDGKVKVTLNDSLVGGTQITAAVRDGRVPMSGALHTYLAAEDPRMGVFNLPGLVDNMAEYAYLCEAFWCDDVAELWEENWNSVVLAEGAWCSQALFSKEPIHTLEDFKGKKLRVHNPQTAALMEAIGAKPAPLPLSEVPPALERGVIDGVFTSTCYGNGQEYWRLRRERAELEDRPDHRLGRSSSTRTPGRKSRRTCAPRSAPRWTTCSTRRSTTSTPT